MDEADEKTLELIRARHDAEREEEIDAQQADEDRAELLRMVEKYAAPGRKGGGVPGRAEVMIAETMKLDEEALKGPFVATKLARELEAALARERSLEATNRVFVETGNALAAEQSQQTQEARR